MPIHNFDYSYKYNSMKTMPKSINDDTQIVREVCVEVTGVDVLDSEKTHTEKMYSQLEGVYSLRDNDLPPDFILLKDITEQQIIDWYKKTVALEDLNIFFTWQIFGIDEVNAWVYISNT